MLEPDHSRIESNRIGPSRVEPSRIESNCIEPNRVESNNRIAPNPQKKRAVVFFARSRRTDFPRLETNPFPSATQRRTNTAGSRPGYGQFCSFRPRGPASLYIQIQRFWMAGAPPPVEGTLPSVSASRRSPGVSPSLPSAPPSPIASPPAAAAETPVPPAHAYM